MTATGAAVTPFPRRMGRKVIKRRLEKCIYKGCPYQRTVTVTFINPRGKLAAPQRNTIYENIHNSAWESSCPLKGYHRRHHRHSQFFSSIKKNDVLQASVVEDLRVTACIMRFTCR
ncbi:uncharacterized protein LOC129796268 [Lutzomyia longipalpis]|uniref:uncharacterized protein LOC129796268 n=1 Tax=Lutzomyia longipalpis TaxID=7200 RepID=UPI002483CAD7|nr:uncharacterized protein LOC129796268 [Lutzomyia longipalpis]